MATPIEDDVIWGKKLRHILTDAGAVEVMDDATVTATVEGCVRRLERFRMGGRSIPLYGLAVLLWRAHDRWPRIPCDVERLLSLGFRITLDPSFVQPEWGIVLIGVLLARYDRWLGAEPGAWGAIVGQCRKNLSYLQRVPAAPPAVRSAVASLLEQWHENPQRFPNGLEPAKRACLESWPDTSSIQGMPKTELEPIIAKLNEKLPSDLSEEERRCYRRHLELEGIWRTLEEIPLR